MTAPIRELLLRLLSRERRRLRAAADAARYGFDFGIRAQKALALVEEAIRIITEMAEGENV